MPAAPVRTAIASEAPIEDLTRGTYGMADEGAPYLSLHPALAGIRRVRPQTQVGYRSHP
jgi:hypothetical protein